MPLTGAMRVWAAGELALAADVVAGPAAGLAGGWLSPDELAEPAPGLVAALALFLVPVGLMVGFPAARKRWWLWIGASFPAALWVPALPFVLLVTGPALESEVGLALAAVGLVGALSVLVGGSLSALDAYRRRSSG